MTADQDWVVGRLARVQGVRHAVVCSVDGLLKARSEGTGQEEADRLAARCSGLLSLARDQAGEFGTGDRALHQLMVGHEGGYLFVRSAAARSCLAVVTEPVINAALIAQEMQAMVLKLGEQTLATPARGSGMT
ncbi:roadblock/LC7 domain-containing protein [Actinomadura viridis]|uniref:roadblock/LC7 domain-containing protein n=1 Tax=Actinomadura viridis TaxID=58110 RepID=UPI0036850BCD